MNWNLKSHRKHCIILNKAFSQLCWVGYMNFVYATEFIFSSILSFTGFVLSMTFHAALSQFLNFNLVNLSVRGGSADCSTWIHLSGQLSLHEMKLIKIAENNAIILGLRYALQRLKLMCSISSGIPS